MKTIAPGLAAHLASGTTTLARAWRLERRDGQVLGFTDHDRDLMVDTTFYRAASGFTASATEELAGLGVANLDVSGALSAEALTEADLAAGRYDGATIVFLSVNWADPAQWLELRRGTLGRITRGGTAFTAELRGLAAALDQPVGRLFARGCAWSLGDRRCQIDLGAPGRHGSGLVTALPGRFDLLASGLDALAADALAGGTLVWSSGALAGLSIAVAGNGHEGSVSRLRLQLPRPEPVAIGDHFTVTAGCDRRFETCCERFANAANFGGFPHMPGNDVALAVARQGDDNDGGRLGS